MIFPTKLTAYISTLVFLESSGLAFINMLKMLGRQVWQHKLWIEWELSLSLSVQLCFLVNMSAEERSLQVIEFSGKKSDW